MPEIKEHIKLIFFDFFQDLRKEGVALDFKQYQLFLYAFTLGGWQGKINSAEAKKTALYNLCKTLWLTRSGFEPLFKRLFEESYTSLEEKWDLEELIGSQGQEGDEESGEGKDKKIKKPTLPKDKKKGKSEGDQEGDGNKGKDETSIGEKDDSDFSKSSDKEVELYVEKGKGGGGDSYQAIKRSIKETPFIFTKEKHLPIPSRKMGQVWKKLQNCTELIEGTQMDVKETVHRIGKEKIILRPSYQKIKKGEQHVIMLIDHKGAMVAFEEWANQLIEIIENSLTGSKVSTYFFYNAPLPIENESNRDFKVFENPSHIASKKISELLKTCTKDSEIIIFSDAGVLDGRPDTETISTFIHLIKQLKSRTSRILWVNPMPKNRWKGSSASTLTSFVKMVEFSFDGIEKGVKSFQHK